MAQTSELTEFRRAFVWLLCGMLLPSVALVAFGVVAVANERAAVERRLAEEYQSRLQSLQSDLMTRLDRAGEGGVRGEPDPLVLAVSPLGRASPALDEAARRVAAMPVGGHVYASNDAQ